MHLSTFDDGVVIGGPVDFRYENPLTAVADLGDDLRGDSGNDTIFGGAGNDTIYGGTGNDIIFGGGDNDILFGEQGDDTLIGGSGNDTAVVAEIDAEGNNAFLVQLTGDGGVRLTHQVLNGTTVGAGSDGSDVLYEVERVRFGANGEEFTIEQVTAAGYLYKGDTFIEANGRLSLGNLDRGIIVTNLAVLSGSRGDYLFSETTDGVNVQRLTGVGAGETFELIDTEYVQLAGMQVVRFDKILSPIPAPEDDHSDTRGTATPINDLDGTVVRGEIEVSGDEDYFTFSTQAGRTYGVVVTPDGSAVDPEIRVYNSSGQLVASNDDFNGVSSAATSFTSSGGTYYVKVAGEDGSTGDYGLGVALLTDGSGDDAPGDAPEPDADLDVDTGRSVTHEGDNGEDTWLFSSSSSTEVFIDARGGDDRVVTGRRDDIVFGGDGEDDIETNGGNDTVSGGDDDDTIDGGSGDDGLVGGDGDDSIEGGSGHDILVGERGKDTLKGDTGDDVISGGEGDDRLDGEDGDDGVLGGDGDDNIDGGDGDDVLYGQDDEDDIDGEDGDDRLYGGNGRDDLNGGEGNDLLDGGDGDDILLGGAGNDRLEGGRDDDLIRPGQGDDDVDGDGGHDTLSYEQTDGGSVIDMNTETARGPEVGLDTFDSIDDVIGTRGRDLILGDGQDNYIDGIHDRDTISGGGGDDSLDGGSSSDTVIYSGNRRDYAITVSTIAGYDFQVVDLRGGSPDGTDQVNSFSFFQFADITIRDDDVLSSAPLAVSDRFEFSSIGPKVLDVLANDADPDGNLLSIIEVSEIPMDTSVYTVGESIVIDLQNAISFGEIRAFSFSYSISDQTGWLSEADVTVSIDLRNVFPTIEGSSGHEQLTGTDLREILMGLAGNDTLLGGGGADELDGGSGFDLASYEGAGERVNLDLRTRGTAGDAAGDTFISIEGVIASDHDDYVYGNSVDNFIFGDQGHDRLRGDGGDDTLEGGSGRDDIHGGSGGDTASFATAGSGVTANLTSGVGTRGNANGDTYTSVENLLGSEHEDLLTGSSGNNLIEGGRGNDTLRGSAGDDTLEGGIGADVIHGGSGTDTASFTTAGSGVTANLTSGVGTRGNANGDTYHFIENFLGSTYGDVLTGSADNNLSEGGRGNDTLRGSAGNDTLEGGIGGDELHGGSGVDLASFETAGSGVTANLTSGVGTRGNANGDTYHFIENFLGSTYGDLLTGSADNNLIEGGRGNDTLRGSAGNDTLEGGIGGDELHGGSGVDLASFATAGSGVTANLTSGHGSRGNANGDTYIAIENLLGSEHADLLTGSSGNNVIEGGRSNDTLRWSAGNDRLEGGIAGDEVNGGSGTDSAAFATAGAGVTVNLTAGVGTRGNANGDTYISIENVIGSNHDDIITGSSGRNILVGGRGDDLLRGSAGNDVMRGGLGNDTLNGGSGADEFRFDAALNVGANVDTIENYSLSHDRISLDDRVFAAIGSSLSSSEFRIGSSAQDGNDYVIYNSTTGALYYDEDGAGAAAQVQFATLTVGIALTVSEFNIV
ncbi:hypothetical protein KL867_17480 [Ruegeria litorea]|uniref:Ca2+-binding protein, RTX toxin-related n=2 Tax=Roseobacteraceae TaxID=2854170 RepID=A0ABS5WUP5_9RHOB|nr:hypothetical protein [Falsiruegeria litorea]MBT3142865.1 hypothetical protein [Falsiruegeria litorea]